MFHAREPSASNVAAFLRSSGDLPLSYSPVGLAGADRAPAGFIVDEHRALLGRGQHVFTRAAAALAEWRHFALDWLRVSPPDAPAAAGTTVAIVVRHLGFWSMHGCRVVYGVGDAQALEAGFAYGTLTNHAESGEEIFKVRLDAATDVVYYEIRAVARPRAALARLGYPLTRLLQARFRRDSARALQLAVATTEVIVDKEGGERG